MNDIFLLFPTELSPKPNDIIPKYQSQSKQSQPRADPNVQLGNNQPVPANETNLTSKDKE